MPAAGETVFSVTCGHTTLVARCVGAIQRVAQYPTSTILHICFAQRNEMTQRDKQSRFHKAMWIGKKHGASNNYVTPHCNGHKYDLSRGLKPHSWVREGKLSHSKQNLDEIVAWHPKEGVSRWIEGFT